MNTRQFSTPMMRQYASIKTKYKDCLLFFRLGDFYELFMEDAEIGANVLEIQLTRRPRGKDGHIPMAGVPYHAADNYIARLVKAGYKVAICEQISEPNKKGIVERDVVRVVTPGTLTDEKNLNKKEGNYTMSLSLKKNNLGIAFADLSTGDFQTTEIIFNEDSKNTLLTEIARFRPSECIVDNELYNNFLLLKLLNENSKISITNFNKYKTYTKNAKNEIAKQLNLSELNDFELIEKKEAINASAALIGYLKETQKSKLYHIQKIKNYSPGDYLILDNSTISNLEIFETLFEGNKRGSFIETMDLTTTSMGARFIKKLIREPLQNKIQIEKRLDSVEELLNKKIIREKIKDNLKIIYDIERIISRLSIGTANPVDLINLSYSLSYVTKTKEKLNHLHTPLLKEIKNNIFDLSEIINLIKKSINDDPPVSIREGKIIKPGFDKTLDDMKNKIRSSKNWIESLEDLEKQRTGISNLKVRFNKVFGYYIEISNAHLSKIPADYERKQTLVNAERFITTELKKHENLLLSFEEKINKLETNLFIKITTEILEKYSAKILKSASSISYLDTLISFSEKAEKENYIRPQISKKNRIEIKDGRHPVVEEFLDNGLFVPNDTLLDKSENQVLLITGPNMAGKSVYMRQVALIVLMAHIGMFVPAKKANISIIDRVFVRSGASDMIHSGLSTFMVEMLETAHILNFATSKSLVIIDEVGRGTSTQDGLSIAWAIIEYIINKTKSYTLFSTHYHELINIKNEFPQKLQNYHLEAIKENNELIFLHSLKSGGASSSYGIEVASLAGVPKDVISRAEEIINNFDFNSKLKITKTKNKENQFEKIIEKIKSKNLSETTPLEALNLISEIQKEINEKN